MSAGAKGWRKLLPIESTPIIGAMLFVSCIAAYRLYTVSKQPEVRFTSQGGVHHWNERIQDEPSKRDEN